MKLSFLGVGVVGVALALSVQTEFAQTPQMVKVLGCLQGDGSEQKPWIIAEWRFRRRRLQRRLEELEAAVVEAAAVVAEVAERALQRVVRLRPALRQEAERAGELRAELLLLPVRPQARVPQQAQVHLPEARAAGVVEPQVDGEVEDEVVLRFPPYRPPLCNSSTCAQQAG